MDRLGIIYFVSGFPETMALSGGAECSTAGNPLTQFTKHVQDDKSLQRDRLAGTPGGLQESMRSRSAMGGGQDQVFSIPLLLFRFAFLFIDGRQGFRELTHLR